MTTTAAVATATAITAITASTVVTASACADGADGTDGTAAEDGADEDEPDGKAPPLELFLWSYPAQQLSPYSGTKVSHRASAAGGHGLARQSHGQGHAAVGTRVRSEI